ncbi:hypothetical protein D3C74_453620 [compost metagenome]
MRLAGDRHESLFSNDYSVAYLVKLLSVCICKKSRDLDTLSNCNQSQVADKFTKINGLLLIESVRTTFLLGKSKHSYK